jgi:hypothetical protein
MQKNTYVRCAYSLGVLLSVLFFHWWVTLLFAVVGAIMFPRYYESLVFFFLLNVLHSHITEPPKVATLTLMSLAVFELIEYLKLQLRVHG